MSGEMSVNLMMVVASMSTFSMYSYLVYWAAWGFCAMMSKPKPVKFMKGIDKANLYGWIITIVIVVYFFSTAS